jgi:hypothetical protein
MFFPGSRYASMTQYQWTRPDGSVVTLTRLPLPAAAGVVGYYRRGGGQRLDQISDYFLKDATAFWQLCDANNTVVPDALANNDLVGIPIGAPITS